MVVIEPLRDVHDRLARAEEHLEPIKRHIIAYLNSAFDDVVGELKDDEEGGRWLQLDNAMFLPDPRMHTLIGEFLHNLRSALDHLAWRLVEKGGGVPNEHTSFPILKVAPTANKKGITPPPTVIGGVSQKAMAVIECAQPYKWGARFAEHPLWLLHELWNIDKHRHVAARGLLIPGFSISQRLSFSNVLEGKSSGFTFRLRVTSATEEGAEVTLVPDDPTVDVDGHSTVEIYLAEPRHGSKQPLWRTLEDVRTAVLTVVTRAEARCF